LHRLKADPGSPTSQRLWHKIQTFFKRVGDSSLNVIISCIRQPVA